MKKLALMAFGLALVVGMTGVACATPVDFDLAGSSGGSSVTVNENVWFADLDAKLVNGLDCQIFTLSDGQTQAVEFFTLKASGILGGTYSIAATLAFDSPDIAANGTGGGLFGTIFGIISGGTLFWDQTTMPDLFSIAGNLISINFENGIKFGCGDTATVHAYIKNHGGCPDPTPTPEPASLLLLGAGLAGLGYIRRKKMRTRD
jgi:hypothetical protein